MILCRNGACGSRLVQALTNMTIVLRVTLPLCLLSHCALSAMQPSAYINLPGYFKQPKPLKTACLDACANVIESNTQKLSETLQCLPQDLCKALYIRMWHHRKYEHQKKALPQFVLYDPDNEIFFRYTNHTIDKASEVVTWLQRVGIVYNNVGCPSPTLEQLSRNPLSNKAHAQTIIAMLFTACPLSTNLTFPWCPVHINYPFPNYCPHTQHLALALIEHHNLLLAKYFFKFNAISPTAAETTSFIYYLLIELLDMEQCYLTNNIPTAERPSLSKELLESTWKLLGYFARRFSTTAYANNSEWNILSKKIAQRYIFTQNSLARSIAELHKTDGEQASQLQHGAHEQLSLIYIRLKLFFSLWGINWNLDCYKDTL